MHLCSMTLYKCQKSAEHLGRAVTKMIQIQIPHLTIVTEFYRFCSFESVPPLYLRSELEAEIFSCNQI